jgi:probable phosphoglycerate mutase
MSNATPPTGEPVELAAAGERRPGESRSQPVSSPMSVRVLLIRHGAVDFDSQDFMQTPRGRQWNPPLSDAGLEEAERLSARLLLMERPTSIHLSPFRRCRQTLEPYVEATSMSIDVDDDLGEVFIGRWEGLRFEDIVSEDEDLARRFREQEAMFSMAPGGETGEQLRSRVVPAIERAIERAGEGTVVLVTHGGVINAYLGHAMGIAQDMFFLPDNASISTVVAEGSNRRVKFLNDVRHLTDPAVFTPPASRDGSTSKAEGPVGAGPS